MRIGKYNIHWKPSRPVWHPPFPTNRLPAKQDYLLFLILCFILIRVYPGWWAVAARFVSDFFRR
jgi:hypothetical protein